jgi:hypothetical protein
VDRAGCRGREVRNSTAEPWPMFGTPVITHRSCPDDWLAQFSLTRAQRWPKAIFISFHYGWIETHQKEVI